LTLKPKRAENSSCGHPELLADRSHIDLLRHMHAIEARDERLGQPPKIVSVRMTQVLAPGIRAPAVALYAR
jgi:hypothetical protein